MTKTNMTVIKKDNNLVAEVDRNELLFWETDDVSEWRLLVVLEVVEDLVVGLTVETNIIDIHCGG